MAPGPRREHAGGLPSDHPYQFTHAPLTSTIEAENFDHGYEGLAYHDTTVGNPTGFCRGQHVDLEPTADASTGPAANVTGTAAGEWLNYSVMNAFPVEYHLELRVATTGASKALHVEGQRDAMSSRRSGSAVGSPSGGASHGHTAIDSSRPQAAPTERLQLEAGGDRASCLWSG
ncbi:carbohydrate-binding domain-containing protein [Sorangium sp. So ce291]|uniref:carbohydrate-binding domain-containing protein n=1 Tax=Sorangium sp. So ce291 TaxID=3133294 RepID=UPI003F5DF78D